MVIDVLISGYYVTIIGYSIIYLISPYIICIYIDIDISIYICIYIYIYIHIIYNIYIMVSYNSIDPYIG